MRVGILGYGEAGPVFARRLRERGCCVSAYDLLLSAPITQKPMALRMKQDGIRCSQSARLLAAESDLILSTVTCGNAVSAALSLGDMSNTDLVDLNSVGPSRKNEIAAVTAKSRGRATSGVAMDTVPQKGADVPLLLSGPYAPQVATTLCNLGLNARCVGSEHSTAAQMKLVRSIFIKGLEAVFVEGKSAADDLEIWDEVCASLTQTFPGLDWAEVVPYHIGRVKDHGARRASEMRECADMLREQGLDDTFTTAISARHLSAASADL